MVPLPAPTAEASDHAVHGSGVCRGGVPLRPYRAASLKLNAPVSQAYTSVTFYTRNSVAYYAINDRAAGRRAIELDLMTPEQHAQVPEEEDVTAADRLIIESPTTTGLIVLRALGAGAGTDADGAPRARQCAMPPRTGAVDYS